MQKIFFLFFILVCIKVYGQNAIPTKEETIKWISEKINKYGHRSTLDWVDSTHYRCENGILYEENLIYLGTSPKSHCWELHYILNLTDIIKAESIITPQHNQKEFILRTDGYRVKLDKAYNNATWGRDQTTLAFRLDFFSEENLFERFDKAFQLLVQYNIAYNKATKPKEAF